MGEDGGDEGEMGMMIKGGVQYETANGNDFLLRIDLLQISRATSLTETRH